MSRAKKEEIEGQEEIITKKTSESKRKDVIVKTVIKNTKLISKRV